MKLASLGVRDLDNAVFYSGPIFSSLPLPPSLIELPLQSLTHFIPSLSLPLDAPHLPGEAPAVQLAKLPPMGNSISFVPPQGNAQVMMQPFPPLKPEASPTRKSSSRESVQKSLQATAAFGTMAAATAAGMSAASAGSAAAAAGAAHPAGAMRSKMMARALGLKRENGRVGGQAMGDTGSSVRESIDVNRSSTAPAQMQEHPRQQTPCGPALLTSETYAGERAASAGESFRERLDGSESSIGGADERESGGSEGQGGARRITAPAVVSDVVTDGPRDGRGSSSSPREGALARTGGRRGGRRGGVQGPLSTQDRARPGWTVRSQGLSRTRLSFGVM